MIQTEANLFPFHLIKYADIILVVILRRFNIYMCVITA